MPQYKHILTDFKDLRKVIGEITKAQPAKTRYQQQAEKMGYKPKAEKKKKKWNEPLKGFPGNEDVGVVEQSPEDGDQEPDKFAQFQHKKAVQIKKARKHAGIEEIQQAYMALGDKAQGSVQFQRGLIQKQLAKMGYKTYSKIAFDELFNRPLTREGIEKFFSIVEDRGMSPGEMNRLRKAYGGLSKINPTSTVGKKLLAFMRKLSKEQLLDIAAAQINFLSLLAVSNLIRMGVKPADIKYTKSESIEEGVFSRIAVDIDHGDNAQKIAKKYKLDLKVVKQMFIDIKKVQKASPNFIRKNENDPLKEGKYLKYSDLLLKKSRLIDKEGPNSKAVKKIDKEIKKEMKRLGISEEILGEGEISDVEKLMKKGMNAKQIGKKKGYSPRRIKALAGMMQLMKQLQKIESVNEAYGAAPAGAISAISDMIYKKYSISKIAKEMGLSTSIVKKIKKYVDDINDPKSDINTKYSKATQGESRSQKVKEAYEHAKQSPFKLKSQQYPRAIAISSDGFGKKHATVEDIISACDSFGMIIDKELQVEQIQKQLGKKGFISYKKSELEDVFEERETERMILALESDLEEQEPTKYTQGEIAYAQLHEHDIEFLKPDGQKTVGPILKMSGSTYNIKDKYTGKSFTYKYSKIEEEEVKTFSEVSKPKKPRLQSKHAPRLLKRAMQIAWSKKYAGTDYTGAYNAIEKLKKGLADDPEVAKQLWLANEEVQKDIQEVSIGPATIRKDFPNVWAQKDDRMNSILMALVNAHGYNDNLKAYKKDKKKFVNDLKKIGKNNASLKKAGLTKRNIGEGILDKLKEWEDAVEANEKVVMEPYIYPKGQDMRNLHPAGPKGTNPRYKGKGFKRKKWHEAEGDEEAYKKFFNATLKKFGVSSPDELEGDKKKKFFNYIDKNWKADHEEVDVHKSYKVDGRRTNFREKMKKLGYIKGV